jgi:hypothetical protein
MTRLTTVAGWAVSSALALLAGCSGTPPGLFIIVQDQVPDANCTIPATLGAVYRSQGLLDVRLSDGYWLFPLLQNDFPGPSGGTDVDANRIALSGYDVDVELAPGAPDSPITTLLGGLRGDGASAPDPLVQYSTLTSGSVASGGGNTASSVRVFPGELAKMIRDMGVLSPLNHYWVMTSVRARGGNLGIGKVSSDAFKFPLELCDGCLIVDEGVCSSETTPGNACNLGQDQQVGCCELAGQLICPAVTLK